MWRRQNSIELKFGYISGLLLALLLCGNAIAQAATCNNQSLSDIPGGTNVDLEVTGPCSVSAGTYVFHNINIYQAPSAMSGGALMFADAKIDLYAESILIENNGSLTAGSTTTPIGSGGGIVTIHLWGSKGTSASPQGITCKSPNCGVDSNVWNSNPRTFPPTSLNPGTCAQSPIKLPGNVQDCFYSYETLDPDDRATNPTAYFGHKVLAVSYGGTLQLFGKKGAIYGGSELSSCKETDANCTGTSWVRLVGSVLPSSRTIVVDGVVDWKQNDHIVITSTDYLASHAEELILDDDAKVNGSTTTLNFHIAANLSVPSGLQYPHNGRTVDLTSASNPGIDRLGLNISSVDTRAAIGLLSRNIRIVSEGDTLPAAVNPNVSTFPPPPDDGSTGYFYGGHTIIRQGFLSVQIQGVEFYQLGQGGDIMHYPVHYHMARATPQIVTGPASFIKDSSIWDSMTRFIVIHATQGVKLARNVGYRSIGHGYYLEDGTETGNQIYANLGVQSLGAVANSQNLRRTPGILTATDKDCKNHDSTCAIGYDNFPFYSDSNHPAVFWIMNGMNDFKYNMAAGAGTCGACYWFVPGSISGLSQTEKWFGYAGEQLTPGRAGMSPLQSFVGNTCSTAMEGFMEVGPSSTCNGVNFMDPQKLTSKTSTLQMLPSDQATENFPLKANDLYWPFVSGGGRLATRCPGVESGNPNADCSTAVVCSDGNRANCDVVVLDKFTTTFNWAQNNFSAIWVRPFWSLVIDSVVGDVQGGGINFVTSGDYSKASVITGFWALARKSALIGSTQWGNSDPQNSMLAKNPFASPVGPFNPFSGAGSKGLACAKTINGDPNNSYCLSQADGISMQLTNWGSAQRLFSVYDGPTYQDSNAYINIHPTYLTTDGTKTGGVIDDHGKCQPGDNQNPCQFAGFMGGGFPGLRAYRDPNNIVANNRCYFPNAAIGWKQPNGFYYAPAFHSTNLFFNGVDIRHFVIEPHFTSSLFSFKTLESAAKNEWCYWTPALYAGYTDIDRETVLNDDDGSLTGLTSPVGIPTPTPVATPQPVNETISVNKETFFNAPIETTECASDVAGNKTGDSKCPPATAKTSPYEYVTAAVFPRCALSVPDSKILVRWCDDMNWGSNCANPPGDDGPCVGIPMYRQLLNAGETAGLGQVKRMMGQNSFQRSGLTANNGAYYIDTTVSKAEQQKAGAVSVNTFAPGGVYDLYFLYTKPDTKQTYQLFVGKNIPDKEPNMDFSKTNVAFGYVDITTAKYKFSSANGGKLPTGWKASYDKGSGILTLNTDMSGIANDFNLNTLVPNTKPPISFGQSQCQPSTMCTWNSGTKTCGCTPNKPYTSLCSETNPDGQTVCSWSVKDLDCPVNGCPGFEITFPSATYFTANNQNARPTPTQFSSDKDFNWVVKYNLTPSNISGTQCNYPNQPNSGMCLTAQ